MDWTTAATALTAAFLHSPAAATPPGPSLAPGALSTGLAARASVEHDSALLLARPLALRSRLLDPPPWAQHAVASARGGGPFGAVDAARNAQRRRGAGAATETTTTDAASSAPASASTSAETGAAASGGEAATSGAGGEAAATAAAPAEAEEEEVDISLLRQRERITRIHKPFGLATFGSLAVTTALGTILAFNRGLLAPGPCTTNPDAAVFGAWGCGGLNAVHGVSAFVTVGLYTATGVMALMMPDPERAGSGNDARATRLRVHRALAWVHLVGMIVQPLLGIVTAMPETFGIPPTASGGLRTAHLAVGYVTFAAYTGAMITELVQ